MPVDKPSVPWPGPPPWRPSRSFSGPPRDRARIPVILDALRLAWEQHPDERLGQLLTNARRGAGIDLPPTPLIGVEDHIHVRLARGRR